MELPRPRELALQETEFLVPAMTCRHCVRAISAQVREVTGVVAMEADTTTRIVRVHGAADPQAVLIAIATAGYEALAS